MGRLRPARPRSGATKGSRPRRSCASSSLPSSPSRSGLKPLDPALGFALPEIAGAAVPGQGPRGVALMLWQMQLIEETRIVGRTQPQRRAPVPGIAGAFVKEPCRGDVANAQKAVAAREQPGDL